MFNGCCSSVSKVTTKKVARKSRQKIEGKGDDDTTTTKKGLQHIDERVVDFLLVLIDLCSLGVTAETLRAIIGSKSAISL